MDSATVVSKVKVYLSDIITDQAQDPFLTFLADLAIERFKQVRNYPSTYTVEQISLDMDSYVTTIAMAVVDVYGKKGAEGQVGHSENGYGRSYENAFISNSLFANVVPFAHIKYI